MEIKTVLQTENVFSRLVTTDKQLLNILHSKLRFRPKNYWHNAAYKRKKWDGYKEFFCKKSGRFMTGLLPEVLAALRILKKPYTFIDDRNSVGWKHDFIDDQFLNQWLPPNFDPVTLRDFQSDLANMCFKHSRGIVQAPTGAGKTFILVSVLKSLPPKTPILFLTKNAGLVHQNWQQMQEWGVEGLGRWYGGYKEKNYVMCATCHKQTFESLKKLLPKFKVLLVDEVHDCISDVPIRAYKKMTNASTRIGFSATPFKWNKKKIDECHKYLVKGHFGPVFKTTTTSSGLLTTKELQDRGDLAASDCVFFPIRRPDLAYEPFQDAVKMGIEQNLYFHDVVKKLSRSLSGRTLIVVERIEQGEYLKSLIPEAHWIQGKNSLKEREPVINALKKGESCIAIIMKPIITAGIDVKIHNLINAAGGEGAHNVIQQMGRGLRTADDKESLKYYDFMFLINDYLRKHSEWRAEVLGQEGHSVTIKEEIDFH